MVKIRLISWFSYNYIAYFPFLNLALKQMMSLINNIKNRKQNYGQSKHEQLVQGIIQSIDEEKIKVGDKLPSINTMVREIGFARKTIVRAYDELKNRGLVESKKMQGFYLISQETNLTLRVALLLYAFQSFQEDFYNTLRNELGQKYQIDVFFHHNNISIFENIISNIAGKYGKYVVAPIQHATISPMLRKFSAQKLLLVDRYLNLGPEYSFVAQEFEKATFKRLVDLLPDIRKYDSIVFIDDQSSHSPKGIQKAFLRFVSENSLKGCLEKEFTHGSVKKDTMYFIKNDTTLWYFLKECTEKEYVLGKDVGVLSFDDNVLKQILYGGITTLSTDFINMAKIAAKHVKCGSQIQSILPLDLFRRNSL